MSDMATVTPSSYGENAPRSNQPGTGRPGGPSPSPGTPLRSALRPWRRRLVLQQALHWTGRGMLAGLLLACLLLCISRLLPWANSAYWALGFGATCIFCALGASIYYRPSLKRTARLLDARLPLQERVSTAWEMRNETTPFCEFQRRDALQHLSKYSPGSAISLRPPRSGLITLSIMAVVLALILLLPNPTATALQQQAAFQARLARQISAIEQERGTLAHLSTTSAQQRAQIDHILRDLEMQLHNANNETQSQQAIAEAQARLNRLRNSQVNNSPQGRANASSRLQSSSNTSLRTVGQALANNDSKQLDAALQRLAAQVNRMTAAQRADLARQIELAAHQASQDPTLRAALQQLARAIGTGSAAQLAEASKAVEVSASRDASIQAQTGIIDQALQNLQQAADNLASATDSTTRLPVPQTGSPLPSGSTQSQNQNQGQGQRQGQGQEQGNSGGRGSGGGKGNNTGNKSGQNEQVFVPGQTGSGSSTQGNEAGNSAAQNGSSVPYSRVIKQYNQMAHDAIDNSGIAPNLKDLVHGYFDALEGQ